MLRDTRHFSAFGTLSPDFLKIVLALIFHSKVDDLRMLSFNVPQLPDSQKINELNSVNFCAKNDFSVKGRRKVTLVSYIRQRWLNMNQKCNFSQSCVLLVQRRFGWFTKVIK